MSVPTYPTGYAYLSQLNPKNPGYDISNNNIATSGYAVFGDNSGNVVNKYLISPALSAGNKNYYETAVVGSMNCFGPSGGIFTTIAAVNPDVSGAYAGTYYSNSVSATRIAADSSANRPANPLRGYIRYNTDTNNLEYWNTIAWTALSTTVALSSNYITFSPGTSITTQYLDSTSTTVLGGPVVGGYTVYNISPSVANPTPIPGANTSSSGTPATPTYTTYTLTITGKTISFSSVVVAGGGGSTGNWGGGGGAGGLLQTTGTFSATSYTLTVGGGGCYGNIPVASGSYPVPYAYVPQTSGAYSSISGTGVSITAIGGGAGGGPYGAQYTRSQYTYNDGFLGGSGGGGVGGIGLNQGTPAGTTGGSGTAGQGNAGGAAANGGPPYACGAGGGGASSIGQTTTTNSTGGNGGNGTQISGFGTSFGSPTGYLAGGGGGSSNPPSNTPGSGGLGGGGSGSSSSSVNNNPGTANTGGGAGGGTPGISIGSYGGSGIILIKVPSYV